LEVVSGGICYVYIYTAGINIYIINTKI